MASNLPVERFVSISNLIPSWLRSRRHRLGLAGFLMVVAMLVFAIIGPVLIGQDPNAIDFSAGLLPPWSHAGGTFHVLGTDSLGRDILARLAAGTRSSLAVVALALAVGGTVGITLGVVAGYSGGWRDYVIMRLADAWLALPLFVFAMLMAAIFGVGFRNTVLSIGFATWSYFARVARGEVVRVRDAEFITAAHGIGLGLARIIRTYVLPNIAGVLAVIVTLELGKLILVESALSFVGLGLQPPHASLGSMIRQGQAYIYQAWWIPTFPGLFIMFTVLGMNLMGDWLRDILDPRARKD